MDLFSFRRIACIPLTRLFIYIYLLYSELGLKPVFNRIVLHFIPSLIKHVLPVAHLSFCGEKIVRNNL